MPTVVVGGALANKCGSGGEAWVRLSWILGLRRLGFDVCFAEQIAPEHLVGADGVSASFESSLNRAYFEAVAGEFGLVERAALICGKETAGLTLEEVCAIAADAELLINISGHLTLEELIRLPRSRVYVDLDPGYTQIWHAAGTPGLRLTGHERFVTVGGNVGSERCSIPTSGIEWVPTAPPIVLEEWPVVDNAPAVDRFTTVATWRSSYGPLEYGGRTYGIKAHEFRKLLDLPRRASAAEFEIALDIHAGDGQDLTALEANGWHIVDPRRVAADPGSFRAYLQGSRAEFSVAQGVYVGTRSGWFSDRTAAYLASGRPALVQDTGLADRFPVGAGLLTFRTPAEAVGGAEAIVADYAAHQGAARELAERHFDSDLVLGRLLDRLGVQG